MIEKIRIQPFVTQKQLKLCVGTKAKNVRGLTTQGRLREGVGNKIPRMGSHLMIRNDGMLPIINFNSAKLFIQKN